MNRLLHTPEIVSLIARLALIAFEEELRRNEGVTNLTNSVCSLARTCRAFYEPACDTLWRQLPGLVPLIKLLPEDSWRLEKVEKEGLDGDETKKIVLKSLPQSSDWSRLTHHSRRVRVVNLSSAPTVRVGESTYKLLHSCPLRFPGLRAVHCWNGYYEDLRFLLSRCSVLSEVLLQEVPSSEVALSIITLLKEHSETLRCVHLDCLDNDDTKLSIPLSQAVRHWRKLTSLSTGEYARSIVLRDSALLSLASFSSLRDIHFRMHPDSHIYHGLFYSTHTAIFPRLHSLSIHVSDASKELPLFIQSVRSPFLESCNLYFDLPPTELALRTCVQFLSNHSTLRSVVLSYCGPSSMLCYGTEHHDLHYQPIQDDTLLYLLSMDLRHLSFSYMPLRLTDSFMSEAAKSWPNLVSLVLEDPELRDDEDNSEVIIPSLTWNALKPFATHCPRLRYLRVSFDLLHLPCFDISCCDSPDFAMDNAKLADDAEVIHRDKITLNFGPNTKIHCASRVAELLLDYFPSDNLILKAACIDDLPGSVHEIVDYIVHQQPRDDDEDVKVEIDEFCFYEATMGYVIRSEAMYCATVVQPTATAGEVL